MLTGSGVRIAVICRSYTYDAGGEPRNDYRPNLAHACFENANLSFHDGQIVPAGVSPHATAISSILFGRQAEGTAPYLAPFPYEGAIPDAEAHIYEFLHFLKQYVNTESIRSEEPLGIDLASASFGLPLEDWWTRGIEALIQHKGLVFVASIGNGANASDPPFFPGAGPNAIAVGVVSSVNSEDPATRLSQFALAYPEESSMGPTHDGRCKPDLIAPGNCLVASSEADQGYEKTGNWSSFATPVVAGVVGLMIQTARENPDLSLAISPQGGNCVVKAVLMNSATKLPHWRKGRLTPEDDHEVPLDYVQGAGMVNAVRAHQLLTAGRSDPGDVPPMGWDLNNVHVGQAAQQVYRLTVDDPEDKMLTATLTWNRHYSRKYPFRRMAELDSDLRLEVWAIDPTNPGSPLLLDYSDSRVDNVEHIYVVTLPGYTLYEIVVSHSDLNAKAVLPNGERYALAWSVDERLPDENILWYDLNADGVVDEQDLAILMNIIAGQRPPNGYVIGDVNMDGVIDARDVEALLARQGRRADWRMEGSMNQVAVLPLDAELEQTQ